MPKTPAHPEKRRSSGKKVFTLVALSAVLCGSMITFSFLTVPKGTAGPKAVNAILVLGAPTTMEDQLSRQQRWRVAKGVAEFQAGRAPRLLFSGGAAANDFVEADTMAREAMRLGVPPSAVLEEREARTTVENIAKAEKILHSHGWNRVEVVTSPDHVRRAATLLAQTTLVWRVVAAPTPGRNWFEQAAAYTQEAVATSLLRWFGPGAEPAIHRIARVVQGVEHWVRQRAWELRQHPLTLHPDAGTR